MKLALPLLTLAVASVLAACARNEAAPAMPLAQVSVAAVVMRQVADADEFTGRIEPVQSVEIRARVSGYLEQVHFKEGSEVRKGDPLFTIDPRPYQAELGKAQAELARAQARVQLARNQVARGDKLISARALSQEEQDQRVNAVLESAANVRAAQAAVDTARLNLGYTRIASPIDGRVSKAAVTVGNLISAGATSAPLTSVVSIDPIYVAFDGDEQTYLRNADLAQRTGSSTPQNAVMVGLADESGYPHEGRLAFLDNQLDPSTGTIHARALLDNSDHRLTPGLFARVKLIGSDAQQALLIDDRAVGTDQSKKFVYVLDRDNKVTYRAVELGKSSEGLRIVNSGLRSGEWIVVNGLQRVQPGATVAPQRVVMERHDTATRVASIAY